ncbi:MAG: gliding motility lipoprotein GldK [Sporocytophaga sp.]|jgi:sulfatase modifying factor 1|uniref:Gliding motility-like protein n=1 Tax=Sporocytophaga myxococcoides TaxID=153721 RepID=A0A098LBF6_9BACT|nr:MULTISPECIES: gliding motility lipoprotein GldK [Sporocytophaga]MBO9701566.1 gliding motility lipoprotein GldK [Sporocytophaga sp.]MCR6637672.1 gliding motility lipoprotein GldK [Sporocytophaga sp.]GAL83708.1 gliding motility-like protein [Sporocytophaga myxococcoides]
MNKIGVIRSLCYIALFGASILIQGCGRGTSDGGGDLVGVQGREGWVMTVPYGMTTCPSGTFHMGQADQDVPATQINLNKQVTIGGFYMDETEITNNEYRQFIDVMLSDSVDVLGEQYIRTELYPDTAVWVKDFAHHMGDPMMEYYYAHPAFDEYPVVGVDWFAARYFCEWRTKHMNNWRAEQGLWKMPNFRLPSEAEWEYAARGGRDMAKYPWGNPYIRNAKGCMLANFKPGRGNYYDDGFMYSSPVASYFSNDFGLYDMAGNVSEWCEDAYYDAAVPVVWDLNPTYYDDDEPRKIIRGGSWKDIAYFLETGTRTFEYQDTTKSYIGFRCVMTYLGRSSGFEF